MSQQSQRFHPRPKYKKQQADYFYRAAIEFDAFLGCIVAVVVVVVSLSFQKKKPAIWKVEWFPW